jgi:hypothetical protein
MVSGRVESSVTPGGSGISRPTRICLGGEVGVVSVPLKATSSDLNRVSKKEHHQEEGGLAQDVKSQAQVSRKVEGRMVKERERSDERETVKWMDREEG